MSKIGAKIPLSEHTEEGFMDTMKGTIICNRCRKKMVKSACACGNTNCYIDLYWKGKHHVFRRDSKGEVFDYREACKTLVNINSEIEDPFIQFNPVDWTDSKIKERKFENQIERWLKEKEQEEANNELSYGTLRDYKGYANNHYSILFGKDVRDIDLALLSELKNGLSGVSPKTRKNIIDALHVFFVWLKRNGVIKEVPAMPEVKGIVAPLYKAMEFDAQTEVLSRIPERHRDVFLFLMETGIRPAEACALTVEDVDLARGIASIVRTFSKNKLRFTTKQKVSRIIPLSSVAFRIMEKHIEKPKFPMIINGEKYYFVFINPTTGKNYLSDTLWKIWRQFSGVDLSVYQGTRHSFGFQLAQKNDLAKVQLLMGHSTIKMTQKYAQVKITTLRDIVEDRGNVIQLKGS